MERYWKRKNEKKRFPHGLCDPLDCHPEGNLLRANDGHCLPGEPLLQQGHPDDVHQILDGDQAHGALTQPHQGKDGQFLEKVSQIVK